MGVLLLDARIAMPAGDLSLVEINIPAPHNDLTPIPGPHSDRTGIRAESAAVDLILPLEIPLRDRGTISLWLRLDETHQTGPEASSRNWDVLSAPGVFALDLHPNPQTFTFRWRWTLDSSPRLLRTQFPGFPGGVWFHLAYEWDAPRGVFNGYINGSSLRDEEVIAAPWDAAEIRELRLRISPGLSVSGLRVGQDLLADGELLREVSQIYFGSADGLAGHRPLGRADLDARKGELLYDNPMATFADVASWAMEGPAAPLEFVDDGMQMTSDPRDGAEPWESHIVFWCDRDFPEDFIAEWEFSPRSEQGLCIVFFAAKGREGEDLFDPSLRERDGIFTNYHSGDINAYHISYFAAGRLTTNLRKNHGFYLAANGPMQIHRGDLRARRVQLMKNGGHLLMTVDGEKTLEFFDDGVRYGPVLTSGKIGFRQMHPFVGHYRNFRVYAVDRGNEENH